MAKHTQGEWGIADIDGGVAQEIVAERPDGNLVNIAEMIGHGSFQMDDGPEYIVSKEEAQANALLLAAAPDLLAAIEHLLHNSTPPYSGDPAMDRDFERRYAQAANMALAAMAKAKGE